MTNYRTAIEALRITVANDGDEDVLAHTVCVAANPTMEAFPGFDWEYEDGDCCAVCGNDLAHQAPEA